MNKTIKAEYTTTEERFKFFAKAQGWQEKVPNPEQPTGEEGEVYESEIENPQTIEQFVQEWADKALAELISRPAVRQTQMVKRQEERDAIQAVKDGVAEGLTVSVE